MHAIFIEAHKVTESIQGLRHILLASFLLLLPALSLPAAPFRDLAISFTQPDGTQVEIRGSGDEFYAVFETLDGYTVVFDPALKAYCFAQLGGDGQLASSGVEVQHGHPAALDASKHLRVAPAIRQEQVRQRWDRWEQGMGIAQRWKATKAALQQREAQPGAGSGAPNGAQPSPPTSATTGNKLGLTLLIDFDDDPATIPQAEIFNFCNGDHYTGYSNNGSVKQYYYDNSNGLLLYSNVVTIYVRIPNSLHPKSYYNDTTKDCGAQANLLIRDAITILKALPNYNTDILPTFSNVGVDGNNNVVAFNVFYAGDNGGVWTKALWPHSGALYDVGAQSLSPGGKKVYRYQVSNIGTALEIGTFCHENGHMLCGYPDLYDYTGLSSGVGDWCLMANGSWGGAPSGSNPSQICAYLKTASGWATITALTSTSGLIATVSAGAGPNFNHFYRFQKSGLSTEYLLAECRYQTGHDAALPGSGVLIWHIDELGDNSTVNLNPNTTHSNYEATVVQADNRWDLEKYRNDGDANDLFYSGNPSSGYRNQFNDSSSPNAHWWAGTTSGVRFTNFSVRATTMTFLVGDLPPTANFSASPTNGAAPLANVTFFDNSTGLITNRSWDFGDGDTLPNTSATNLLHTYLNVGSYSPTLTVSGPGGTSITNRLNYIVVTNTVPVADFVANPTNGMAPLTVWFTNSSSGVVTNVYWDFGEGWILNSNAPAIAHTYAVAGIYSVNLTVGGPSGTGSTTKTNYIVVTNGPPVASFAGSPTNGLTPLVVAFTNTSLGVTTHALWSFGDGTTTIATNMNVVQHIYSSAGSYTACLTATGPYGTATCCSNNYIVVTNPPPNLAVYGDGSLGQRAVPGQATNSIAIAAGAWHNLALLADGKVVAWGNDSCGQCAVPAVLQNAQDTVAIAAGGYHSLAIRLNGTVIAWGADDYEQTNVPAGLTGVIGIAAGTMHSVALRHDGTILVWGDNSLGQTNQPPGLTNVTAVAAGGNHTLALKADGTVAAWGENTGAEGNWAGQSIVPWGLTDVVAIGAGDYHSLAVRRNGKVMAWGDNSQGQCSVSPELTNVVAVAGGGGHSLALRADGTVAAWGADWNGQCDLSPALAPAAGVAAGESDTVVLLATNMPPPRLLNPARKGHQFAVLVQTLSGRNYVLEFTDSLAEANWTGVCTNTGTGALRGFTDPTATGARCFYRLRQW